MESYEYTALYNKYAKKILKEVDALTEMNAFTDEDKEFIEEIVSISDLLLKNGAEHRYFNPESRLLALFFQGVKYGVKKSMDGTLVLKRNKMKAAAMSQHNNRRQKDKTSRLKEV